MSGRHAICAALIALVLIAVHSCTASAAQVTLQPSPAEARTFSTTNGGWSSVVDYNGLVCIPGVTCPSATPSFQPANGSGGARDGFLRSSFGTLLGVLSTTTISWASPSFVAPSGTDAATLAVNVRPQIASLLAIGTVRLDMRIIDVVTPASSTLVASVPITTASSSFGPVQVTVPPSAVVAGRSYRVQLDTALTTSVSAVTSGNVDLDDVVLRLSDLEAPSGLTATVPGTGAPRITGAVDPAGLATSVVAEYGLTAAYGSSTTPVAVNGSGSQPFTIPLAGLTPGATYHYRVVATNADGRAETLDATFVAPTPPADSPPVVTGAGNNRNRTVTYDRPGDVADASVELLDGGGVVIATVNDGDGDGTVAIVLPDADGTYGVRVVRENAARVSSTSATVPAVLDRVAPDVSGVAILVRPQVSRDTQRTVEFTAPGDVVSVSAQVIDGGGADVGAPVTATGGTAIVQLGAAEGDYRVRLTFQDAAGNAATSLSGIATVDTTAPSSGGAPNVTGDGNSRDRDVTFDRDLTTLTATIEAVDRDGTVVATTSVLFGNSGSIRLPDADGDYTIRVRQTDLGGNSSTTAGTPVTLDRVAPSPGPAPTVVGAATSRDRDVTFQRDLTTATATIELLDGARTVVASVAVPTGSSGSIRLPDADGAYEIRIRQTDAATNSATSPVAEALLDRLAPTAGPAPTVTGAGNERERAVTFTRDADSATATIEVLDRDGTVVVSEPVASGGSGSIRLPDLDGAYDVRVRQSDAAGNSAVTPLTDIVLDRVAPAAGPAPSVTGDADERDRAVSFTRAPGAADVAIELLDRDGRVIDSVAVPSGSSGAIRLPDADGSYDVRVRQSDAAGNSAVTPSTGIVLDRVAPAAGPAPTVTGAGNARTRTVAFTRDGDTAVAVIEVLGAGGTVVVRAAVPVGLDRGTVTLPDLDGSYSVRVAQSDVNGNTATSPETEVALDRAAPDPGPAPTVTGAVISRDRNVTFARATDAASATIELLDVNGSVVGSVAVAAGGSGSIRLPDADGSYAVRIRQTDAAGNSAVTGRTAVELDRGAPLPGDAPTVTGASNSRERTVSFRRAGDTTLATIEVLDGAGNVVAGLSLPTGNGGVVTLPARDGDYRVRVRQQDGNGFSSLTPETRTTLDTSAPDAGPAPSTSGAPDALLVTFRRAPDAATATIEVLDRAGNVVLSVPVPSGDSATLDLPDAAGAYTIRVVQTDGAGNSATTPIATVTRAAGGGGGGAGGGGTGGGSGTGSGPIPVTDPGGFGTVLGHCFGGDLVLTDVTVRGTRVTVSGLTRYAPGTAVTIVDLAGKPVGSAVTDAGGRFGAAVTAPRAARARLAGGYRAVVGSASSRVVKVRRANVLSAVTVRGTTITLRGRVDLTRLGTLRRVRAYGGAGAAACRRSTALRAVGRTLVDRRTGMYMMRVRAPAGSGKLVLRTRAYGSKLTSRSSFLVK
ncbi:hypothetical protein VSS74_14730 [Conexibacter stalactiti]|uniref:Fibronectin type-III domain-containing protein n=1 Tax=Conexibacter stalactiti TaxID=1940611 RepID=A0ABU4HQP7_9ACTN|nr:hypothetical protein [Conexibacter stalactiti]MDW5595602.1 hypothetical protein [Conexibacter stalactiti]MEC5036244.1 hypothetical protein [Conexibacter stalactiti]